MLGLDFEKEYWDMGQVVSGGDEVGMGAFAGPVVASVVSFAPKGMDSRLRGNDTEKSRGITINDSKKLSEKRRVQADKWIRENASFVGIGEGSVEEINTLGIRAALGLAYKRAVASHDCDLILVDGFEIKEMEISQKAVVRGDSQVFSIAAASIVAKVYRDNLMVQLSEQYGSYGWVRNKGYGTAEHREKIVRHGTTPLHRKQYVMSYLAKSRGNDR